MDDSRLNISEFLRAWHFAGVRHFFIDKTDDSILLNQHRPTQWKSPWCIYFEKVPASAFLFFTYYDLGKDLAGHGDSERRNFLRRFIPFFQLPKGSIAFWPLAIYVNSTYQEQIQDFLKTITYFSPSLIVCFGNDCELAINKASSVEQVKHLNFFYYHHFEQLFNSSDNDLSLLAKQILSQVPNR
ncbi:hypothetical protein G3N56_07355 [Desulfovibrio sulfodismutans]|uniref:Uncharacterized protein n=1 Tax=Desulfolutivibrio sulfodismutans TaxID=63561 RepID=A0A7K3NK26_9BACT|nr:hypothetical protein [Desulfolutivibrio sulfodismutans]NDY56558.1 hypothetical protein [Desulfolutivibrio sulfodismutans]QLA13111.1 hypothetical protein GD606_12955 [Desulfolutivibrio sulfodismutans DSM 3696]